MTDPNIQRAQLLYNQGRFDLAADAVRESLGQSPHDAYAHGLLALCLLHQKKYDDAAAEADAAVHLAPDFPFAHYVRGVILQERNLFAKAQAAAQEALRLAPEDPDYWALLAQTFLARFQWREALDAADHGLQFDPDHTTCINLRAMALVKLGLNQAAADSIAGALQRNPHSAPTHANQGWTLLHQNNPKQALEHFREALRLDPNNQWARDGTLEALKARHLAYRLMLRYYLWMSRFSRRGQWGIIIGLWVAYQVLNAVNSRNPALAPFIYPLLIAYGLFILATWLVDPLFNLTLLLSPYGRHLLTTAQIVGALAVGLLLFAALSCGIIVLLFLLIAVKATLFMVVGLLCALLNLPTAATAKCQARTHLLIMTLYTAATAVTAVLAVLFDNSDLFIAVIWACMLSALASNILRSIIPKK